jgi:hypothetical protein
MFVEEVLRKHKAIDEAYELFIALMLLLSKVMPPRIEISCGNTRIECTWRECSLYTEVRRRRVTITRNSTGTYIRTRKAVRELRNVKKSRYVKAVEEELRMCRESIEKEFAKVENAINILKQVLAFAHTVVNK